jgi:alpha-glucosidase
VIIQDAAQQVYQVPSSVLARPDSDGNFIDALASEIVFDYVANPFSLSVTRRSNGQVLFDTSAAQMVFESQYLRLRTKLPSQPSLYGLAEHTDPL